MLHDRERLRFELMQRLGRLIYPRYRHSWYQFEWWDHKEFNDYLDRFGERNGLNDDRRWMVAQLMRLVEAVPGDTAECGVYQGAGSFLISTVNANGPMKREHHIFDSFAGLSQPETTDGNHWTQGDLCCGLEQVKRALEDFKGVSYYKGWIPERFPEVADRTFSFVHIDVDLEQPTRDSLEFFYPRMSEGGILVCDDYGYSTCPGATTSIDDYLSDKAERMLALSRGGGFLIKGVPTAESCFPALQPSCRP